MAGEWIKMRADLMLAPQFERLRYELQPISDGDILLLLYRVAGWFEVHARYGQMDAALAQGMDTLTRRPGLFKALHGCGWIKVEGGRARLSGFARPSATRKSLGAKVRAEVLSSGACAACGSTGEPEIDHAVPVSRGGGSDRANLQRLCATCNRAKGRRTMAEFLADRSQSECIADAMQGGRA